MNVPVNLFIAGRWVPGDNAPLRSENPATGETVHDGRGATPAQVDAAVSAARGASEAWADRPFADRVRMVRRFAEVLAAEKDALAATISRETGKPRWEARTEVEAMVGKVAISLEAHAQRTGESRRDGPEAATVVRHRPHGTVAVLGPFNFPGHLPNGHLVPALLAGNTAIFKPSELTPAVAAHTVTCWEAAGLPPGVLNLVQGGADAARALAAHPGIDGLYFTGSARVGLALHRAFGERPDKVLALEMGGNNPLVVVEPPDVPAAVYLTILSAFLTAGQRCTAARRLVVVDGPGADVFLEALARAIPAIRVGPPIESPPEPFSGPLIHRAAAQAVLDAQEKLAAQGARALVPVRMTDAGLPFLQPGLLDVTAVEQRPDEEIFGPLLQVIRVPDFDAALAEANRTRFGLAAGLLGGDAALFERFARRVRAGVVNWNRPTTGASSAAPFGGVGLSGNHRPSAFYAADYCAFPVASLEADAPRLPTTALPGLPGLFSA